MQNPKLRVVLQGFRQFKLILEGWKERITLHGAFDECEEQIRATGKAQRVNFRATAQKNVPGLRRRIERVETRYRSHARMLEAGAAEDNRFAVGKRFADGLERLASHYHDIACGHALEPFEVGGEMPWNGVAAADDTILAHGGDGF